MDNFERFQAITNEMGDTYKKKNHDYGNSFDESLDEHGLIAAIVRIGDKYNRIKSLNKNGQAMVKESMRDTFLDMANYCIMSAMWLDAQNDKKPEENICTNCINGTVDNGTLYCKMFHNRVNNNRIKCHSFVERNKGE